MLSDADDCSGSPSGAPPPTQMAIDMARQLRVLADPVRLRIMSILLSHEHGSARVHELTEAFDVTEPTISHHLKALRDAGLVDCEVEDARSFHSVTPIGAQLFRHVMRLFDVPPPGTP